MKINVDIKEDERRLTRITEEDELQIWADVLRDAGFTYSTRIIINPETETETCRVSIKDFLTREEFNELIKEAKRRAIKLNDDRESQS